MGDHDINISFADRVRDWLFHLDRILRGEATRPDKIRNAEIRIPILGITGTIVMLAIAYGFCMAVFAMVHGYESGELSRSLQQTFATMLGERKGAQLIVSALQNDHSSVNIALRPLFLPLILSCR